MRSTDWEGYEFDFLIETYPSKEWSVALIAEKLEKTESQIRYMAEKLNLNRPGMARQGDGRRRKLNYSLIRKLSAKGWSPAKITRHLGCANGSVHYALKQIREKERGAA